ncbi:hypothetical protein PR048_006590 [Dryococelus australis]|uniref:Uncharacterized protein n=1 Tax=Dryococelus australis TaxID=614101 RepID=A0ABQ9IBD4_9NEOP|nr:hypothetical protein PR048_006590 [Dryococelus australis]
MQHVVQISSRKRKNILLSEENKLRVENDVHEAKAEAFYTRKRNAKIKSRKYIDSAAIVMDFQKNLITPNIATNHSYTVVRYLHYVRHCTRRIDSIQITFPVRGYSYLECNHNMALIQLKTPAELPEHIWQHFSVPRVNALTFPIIEEDKALLRAWSNFLSPVYKRKCPFVIRPMKVLLFQHVLRPIFPHR